MDFLISKEALYFYTPVGMVLRVKLNMVLPKFNKNSHFFCLAFGIHLVALWCTICFCLTLKFYSVLDKIHNFQNVSSRAPLGQSGHTIPTFYSKLNEDCEKICFSLFWAQKGGVWGVWTGLNPVFFAFFFAKFIFKGYLSAPKVLF